MRLQNTGPQEFRSGDDLVHFGDIIDIDVQGSFEYDWRGSLTPDGFLDGFEGLEEPLFALCRSEAEVAAGIERSLARILREPKVVVRIVDRSNRAVVRLDGAVRTPTRFQVRRPVRLRELLVLSGGLIDGTSGEITIVRPRDLSCQSKIAPAAEKSGMSLSDNGPIVTNIKVSDLLAGKIEADPDILSGDIVSVNRALPIYVIGAVANPRPVYSREKMTLSRVISSAGGVSKEGESGKAFIFRRSGPEVRSLEVDLARLKAGESIDEVLQPFDIIEVVAKGASRSKFPPVMATDESSDPYNRVLPLRIVD